MMIGLDEIYIEAYILCKYVLTEVFIFPTVSSHLIHPHPSPSPYGSFLLVLFTFLQYKITSDRGWHSSPRLPPCLFHEWAWKELLYQRCGQRTPPVGIQAISPVTQPTYHQPNDILIPRISAQQEPLLPIYRLETKHFYCQGEKSPQQLSFTCTVLKVKSETLLEGLSPWTMNILVCNWTKTMARLVEVKSFSVKENLGGKKRNN